MLAVRSPSADKEKTLILGGGPDAGAGPCPDERPCDPQKDEVIVVDSFDDDADDDNDDAPLHGCPGRNIGQVKRRRISEAILPATHLLPPAKVIASSGGPGKTRVPVRALRIPSARVTIAACVQKVANAKAVSKVSGNS